MEENYLYPSSGMRPYRSGDGYRDYKISDLLSGRKIMRIILKPRHIFPDREVYVAYVYAEGGTICDVLPLSYCSSIFSQKDVSDLIVRIYQEQYSGKVYEEMRWVEAVDSDGHFCKVDSEIPLDYPCHSHWYFTEVIA